MAVYTEVADDELEAFVSAYDIGSVHSFKGIAEGVENSNFLLRTERASFILTLYEKRVEENDLPFFIGLLEHLSAHGVICPQPVRNRTGRALGRLAGKPAALVTFLEGVSIKRPDARHCGMVGEALGSLHKAGAAFASTRANALSFRGWLSLFRSVEARAHEVQEGLAPMLTQEIAHLYNNWPKALPSGIIHGDLFPDNVFFLGGKLSGLIDFYFACNDFHAFDLAICLNAWCFEPDASFNITKGMALINGYERVRRLSAQEAEALPILARGAAVRFLLTRLADWLNRVEGALVRPKDPMEYVKKLGFHQQASSARDYGLLR